MSKSRINLLLQLLASLGGIYYGTLKIIDGDIYGSLISFSIILTIFAPDILRNIFGIKIGKQLENIYCIFIFFSHFLGSVADFYYLLPGYDKVMHMLSGILTSFTALVILIKWKEYKPKKTFYNILYMVMFTMMIAGMWEFFEFTCDYLFVKDAQNVNITGVSDTMWDMLMAFFGSIGVSLLYIKEKIFNKNGLIIWFIEGVKSNE